MSKAYVVVRNDWSVKVNVLQESDPSRADSKTISYGLHPRWDLVKHSEDFGWGKDNCATSQLALALLCDHLGVTANSIAIQRQAHPPADQCRDSDVAVSRINRVMALYPLFAKEVLCTVPFFQKEWTITSEDIERWVSQITSRLDGKIV